MPSVSSRRHSMASWMARRTVACASRETPRDDTELGVSCQSCDHARTPRLLSHKAAASQSRFFSSCRKRECAAILARSLAVRARMSMRA